MDVVLTGAFHGKVAAMVVTTSKLNRCCYAYQAEIEMMITDPVKMG